MLNRTNGAIRWCGALTYAALAACSKQAYQGPTLGPHQAPPKNTIDVSASADLVVQSKTSLMTGTDGDDRSGRATVDARVGFMRGAYARLAQGASFDRPLQGTNASGVEDLY